MTHKTLCAANETLTDKFCYETLSKFYLYIMKTFAIVQVGYVKQQRLLELQKKGSYTPPQDPQWPAQWSLVSYKTPVNLFMAARNTMVHLNVYYAKISDILTVCLHKQRTEFWFAHTLMHTLQQHALFISRFKTNFLLIFFSETMGRRRDQLNWT